MKVELIPADVSHVSYLADHMRDQDRTEIQYSSGADPYRTVSKCINRSHEAFTVLVDNNPALSFGKHYPVFTSYQAMIWMLSTHLIHEITFRFLKYSRHIVNVLSENTDCLYNYVWEGNIISINWLKWLGFTIYPPEPFGVARKPFHYFELRV